MRLGNTNTSQTSYIATSTLSTFTSLSSVAVKANSVITRIQQRSQHMVSAWRVSTTAIGLWGTKGHATRVVCHQTSTVLAGTDAGSLRTPHFPPAEC